MNVLRAGGEVIPRDGQAWLGKQETVLDKGWLHGPEAPSLKPL